MVPSIAVADPHDGKAVARYAYLDALRGWAVLGVVAIHCAFHIKGAFVGRALAEVGKYGVQLFFMVSAFTIFLTLDRARETGGQKWAEWTAFFIRRFFRVLPMFWVGLALYACVPGRAPEAAGLVFTPPDYLLTAVLQHAWSPRLLNTLVPGGWSIAVEGVFYLLAPWCHRFIRNWQAALCLLLGSLVFAEVADEALAALYRGQTLFVGASLGQMLTFAYCWFPAQFPVFACGILVYQIVRGLEARPPGAAARRSGAALIAASFLAMGLSLHFGGGNWVTDFDLFAGSFGLLIVGLRLSPVVWLVNPWTCFLGKISYSVYLLHFAVLGMAARSLENLLPDPDPGPLVDCACLFVLTLAGTAPLSWLAYRAVEQPGIRLGKRLIAHLRTHRGNAAPLPPAGWHAASAESRS